MLNMGQTAFKLYCLIRISFQNMLALKLGYNVEQSVENSTGPVHGLSYLVLSKQ